MDEKKYDKLLMAFFSPISGVLLCEILGMVTAHYPTAYVAGTDEFRELECTGAEFVIAIPAEDDGEK